MAGGLPAAETFVTGRTGHLDVPKANVGGFGGGFFAIWVPSPRDQSFRFSDMDRAEYDLPLPPPLEPSEALDVVMAETALLFRLQELGVLEVCTTANQIRACLERGEMAAIFHIEGAEAVDGDFHVLDVLYQAGLRSLGPVWSRPTRFAEGVPFRFPSSPDIGGGLTADGVRLVEKCNALGIMIDLSHLNAAGFWDVAKYSTHPLVTTHSNAHVLCPHARNLTDAQLEAIADSDGMVGLNLAVAFLREDGRMQSDVPLDQVLRHFDHLISILGEDRVGFGSDFDGAVVPQDIGDVSGLPNLRAAMRAHGYDDTLMAKLCYGNWLRVLEQTWGG